MRKIFIDCGSHVGSSIDSFRLRHKDFEIFCFEPLKKFKKYHNRRGVKYYQAAVWTSYGTIDFYEDKTCDIAQGSSILINKTSGKLDKKHPVTVECIDFSKWIESHFSIDDYIAVKMDIEGAEYEVLNKMILDQTIGYIDDLYMEWHYHKIDMNPQIHEELYNKVKGLVNLHLNPTERKRNSKPTEVWV